MSNSQDERLLKVAEVARRLDISRTAAYRLMGTELLCVRFGGAVRVRASDLERFIVTHLDGPAEQLQDGDRVNRLLD